MLSYLSRFITPHAGYKLPEYTLFIQNILIYLNKHVHRTELSMGYESPGISKIRQILNAVDYKWIQNRSHLDIYLNYLRYEKDVLDMIFSQVNTGQDFHGLYVSGTTTSEYLIPVDDVDTFNRLPINESWIYWKYISPLKLHWTDTLELTFNVINSRIQYHKQQPVYNVYTLDTLALILKYIQWNREGKNEEIKPEDALTQQLFIHKYIIAPLLYDLTDCWLLQAIAMTIQNQFNTTNDVVSNQFLNAIDDSQYAYMGIRLSDGFRILFREMQNIIHNTHPKVLLNSPLFLNKRSLYKKYLYYQYMTPIATLSSYEYLTIMRDIDLYDLILSIYKLSPNLPVTKSMMIEQKRQWNRILNRKPWNKCRNTTVSQIIQSKFLMLINKYT